MMGRLSRKNSGLTVLEVMATMAIAAVVLAIAVPSFVSWLPTLRLSSAARQVATDLQVARMRAISRNATLTVTFNTSSGTYTYDPDTRDIDTLYPGISFVSVAPANPVFTPRGTASAAVTITLTNGTAQRLVCVRPVGRVNVADTVCGA